jgi:hypothetical protein
MAGTAERGLAELGGVLRRPLTAAPGLTPRRARPPTGEALPAALLAALAGASATGRLLAGLAVAEWARAAKAAAAEPVLEAVVQAVHAAYAVPGAPAWSLTMRRNALFVKVARVRVGYATLPCNRVQGEGLGSPRTQARDAV